MSRQVFTPFQNSIRSANLIANPETISGGGWGVGTDTLAIAGAGASNLGPFGTTATQALVLSGDGAIADQAQIFAAQIVTTFPAAGTFTVFSCFVKRPPSGTPVTQFSLDIKDQTNAILHEQVFQWSANGRLTVVALDGSGNAFQTADEMASAVEVVDGWWRVATRFMVGRGQHAGITVAGNQRRAMIRLRDADNTNKALWIWGAMMEENTGSLASPYLVGATHDSIHFFPLDICNHGVLHVNFTGTAAAITLWGRADSLLPWVSVQATIFADIGASGKVWTGLQVWPEMKFTIDSWDLVTTINASLVCQT